MSIITVNADKTNNRPSASDIVGISTTDDLTEGSVNLYYTDARVQDYLDSGISVGDVLTVEQLNITNNTTGTLNQYTAVVPGVYHTALGWRTHNNYKWNNFLLSGTDDGTHNQNIIFYGDTQVNISARDQSNALSSLNLIAQNLQIDASSALDLIGDITNIDGATSVTVNSPFFDIAATNTYVNGQTTISTQGSGGALRLDSGSGNKARLFTDTSGPFFSTLNHHTGNGYKVIKVGPLNTGTGDDGTHNTNIRLYGDTQTSITCRNQSESIVELLVQASPLGFNSSGGDITFTTDQSVIFDQDLECVIRSYNDNIYLEATQGKVYLENTTPFQFANMTTTTRNGLSAAPGMVIFNTTDSKLQVYDGTTWADLH